VGHCWENRVDGLDFVIWNANKFTSAAAWSAADFNADGVVDGQDFIIWNNHKFTSADSGLAFFTPTPLKKKKGFSVSGFAEGLDETSRGLGAWLGLRWWTANAR
jgi:hypothetical protein